MPWNKRRKKVDTKTHRSDLKYKEIRRLLARKEKEKRDHAEDIIQEFYVDSNRMISVQMQADDDLRTMMQHSGIKSGALANIDTGEPTSKSYVQLAHYHMKAGRLEPGLYYLEVALSMDPDSILAMNSIARCHLRMGNWSDAMKAAEIVMSKDRKNTNAIQIKAEGLYNSCFFEHALVLFHRGQALAQDNEAFRLGINKCHKTINDTVSDKQTFRVPGAQILFRLLATASEMHSGGGQKYGKRRAGMSFKGLLTNVFQQNKAGNIAEMAKAAVKENAGVDGLDIDKDIASKLKAVELIFGAKAPEFDAKVEHEKATASARTKAQKLLGDVKTRAQAKKDLKKGKKDKTAAEKDDDDDENKPKKIKKPKETLSQMLAKAEAKQETEEEIKERKRIEKEKEREKRKNEQKRKAVKVLTSGDRLLEDKVYLSMLAEGGIGSRADLVDDIINEDVCLEAKEALDFLNAREKFWDQLDCGSEAAKRKSKRKGNPSVESFRFLM